MNYSQYAYLWPPRPEQKTAKGMLPFFEKRGYVAQVKKNGTCTVIFVKGKQVIFKTRHNDDHKMWTPTVEHNRFFQNGSNNWNVYVAELLHSKTPHIKNQLYLFDKIVHEGTHLVGVTFEERQSILNSQWADIGESPIDYTRVHEYVGIARNFSKNFAEIFTTLNPEDEGLVLKNPTAKLKACLKQGANDAWQVKCRIPHKNYGF